MARVGLVFGGRSVEHEISLRSARTVRSALEDAGHKVVALGISQGGQWLAPEIGQEALEGEVSRLPAADGSALQSRSSLKSLHHLLESEVDILFPIVHGTWGEDGCLQGLAEMAGLPYVGCDVPSSAVAMDKILCKISLERAGIPVVEWTSFTRRQFAADPEGCLSRARELAFPLFVKPAVGGSSVGIRKAADESQLEEAVTFALRFGESVLVERGVVGRELECAVLGHGRIEASVVGEIVAGREFYDYADKYIDDGAQLLAPAEQPEGATEALQDLAVRAFEAIGGSGLARVDFFLERTRFWERTGSPSTRSTPCRASRLFPCTRSSGSSPAFPGRLWSIVSWIWPGKGTPSGKVWTQRSRAGWRLSSSAGSSGSGI